LIELKGMPVVTGMKERFSEQIRELGLSGIIPKLAVVRVGEREDDIAYEKGIFKRFEAVGAAVDAINLPADVCQDELERTIISLNNDKTVHGIIVFRPLPAHLCADRLKNIIDKNKDVDCMGTVSAAAVFEGSGEGYPPCTPQAVIEMLDYYNIDISGKNAVIVGRSQVVGKPLAMLLLGRNATVTVCHTKTVNLEEVCKRADILIACAGSAGMINAGHLAENQVVIDVGINVIDGQLCGDVDYAAAQNIVRAATPVPGGVGTVTTSVLLKHTIESAKNFGRVAI